MQVPLSAVIQLMEYSDIHRKLSVPDICRRLIAPMELTQFVVCVEDNRLKAFVTVGFFSDSVSKAFRSGTHTIQKEDWNSGSNVWLVDLVAPFGHARQITSGLRTALCGKGYKGCKINFRRNYSGKIRYSGVVI